MRVRQQNSQRTITPESQTARQPDGGGEEEGKEEGEGRTERGTGEGVRKRSRER